MRMYFFDENKHLPAEDKMQYLFPSPCVQTMYYRWFDQSENRIPEKVAQNIQNCKCTIEQSTWQNNHSYLQI